MLENAFGNHPAVGKEPDDGAESAGRLAIDGSNTNPSGTYWDFEQGESGRGAKMIPQVSRNKALTAVDARLI